MGVNSRLCISAGLAAARCTMRKAVVENCSQTMPTATKYMDRSPKSQESNKLTSVAQIGKLAGLNTRFKSLLLILFPSRNDVRDVGTEGLQNAETSQRSINIPIS